MHRFGRSATRWRDRLGGNFLLVVVLVVVGTFMVVEYVRNQGATEISESTDSGMPPPLVEHDGFVWDVVEVPRPFTTVHLLQVGSFNQYENADRLAADLDALGFGSWVSPGPPYKVVAGAFGSREAARTAGEELKTSGFGDYYAVAVELMEAPAVTVTTGTFGVEQDLTQGFGALENYLYETAAWWDAYQLGAQPSTQRLTMYTTTLNEIAQRLSADAHDAQIGRFLELAALASHHAQQLSDLTAAGGAHEYRSAMNGYLDLLAQYRRWTDPF